MAAEARKTRLKCTFCLLLSFSTRLPTAVSSDVSVYCDVCVHVRLIYRIVGRKRWDDPVSQTRWTRNARKVESLIGTLYTDHISYQVAGS